MRCPFLREDQVRSCGAAGASSAAEFSRCTNGAHRFCNLYFEAAVAQPIKAPSSLYYSANHMWIDFDDEGGCHVGIDAVLARFLGPPDAISFLTPQGLERPVAIATVRGLDLPLVFPYKVMLRAPNYSLRSHPARLAGDPYGAGWLYEAGAPADLAICADLRRAADIEPPMLLPDCGRLDSGEALRLFRRLFSPCATWEHVYA